MTDADLIPEFLTFIDRSPSPYHAVGEAQRMLTGAGFTQVRETERWRLEPGGGYFVVRAGKTIVAWRQGQRPAADAGFRIIAAHTDSPVLKLRPEPFMATRGGGYLTTEVYGSPLLHTWLDRDLALSGAAFFQAKSGEVKSALIALPDLYVRAASLAPHLKQGKKFDELAINTHKDLPVLFIADADKAKARLEGVLARLAADWGKLVWLDVFLSDTQPAALIGAEREFISAPRLDNLHSSFSALKALIAAPDAIEHTAVAALYDAEEIGSRTWSGAQSNVLDAVLARIGEGDSVDALLRAKARSVLLSADMAHAEHPSFPDATDAAHAPQLNHGVAIKSGARGNYAIAPSASAWFECVCADAGLATQRFMYRCDHGAGSSVGPIVSSAVGIEGVDVGAPMLAMHSIRELAGARDLAPTVAAYAAALAAERKPARPMD
jgi:aspartyl aminopeptidase